MEKKKSSKKWIYLNGFGDPKTATEQDMITSLKFDQQGSYLAAGDKAGRVIIFKKSKHRSTRAKFNSKYYTEFQSHDSEFDVLNSVEVEEKINQIEWMNKYPSSPLQLLTTTDKTIKLFRINTHTPKHIHNFNLPSPSTALTLTTQTTTTSASSAQKPYNEGSNQASRQTASRETASHNHINNTNIHISTNITNTPNTANIANPSNTNDNAKPPNCANVANVTNVANSSIGSIGSIGSIDSVGSVGVNSVNCGDGRCGDGVDNGESSCRVGGDLRVPTVKLREAEERSVTTRTMRVFAKAHQYNINSLALTADNQNFLVADDLRINLCNLHCTNVIYSLIDLGLKNVDDLTSTISSTCAHYANPNLFIYSSTNGVIYLYDLRISSQCDPNALVFSYQQNIPSGKRNFFTDILNSVSYAKFSPDSNSIISREYTGVKIWDLRNNSGPFHSVKICGYLENKLCQLYETENVFDRFPVESSGDFCTLVTGSYAGHFHIWEREAQTISTARVSLKNKKGRKIEMNSHSQTSKKNGMFTQDFPFDLNMRVQYVAYHPFLDVFALSKNNCLFLYEGQEDSEQ